VDGRKHEGLRQASGSPFSKALPKPQRKAKHVESIFAACLDEGSNPSSSTRFIQETLQIDILQGFFIPLKNLVAAIAPGG